MIKINGKWKHTEETKLKIKISKIGKKRPKQSERMKGENNPSKKSEVREKLKENHWTKNGKWTKDEIKEKLGSKLKGKTFEEIHGKEKAIELKKNMSLRMIGKYVGDKNPSKRPEVKQKQREAAYKNKPKYKNTKPEIFMQNLLKENNINFTTHKNIYGIPDIFIEPNFCIFIDGEYWHNYPYLRDKDIIVNKTLKNKGYKVLRFWAKTELYENPKKCLNKIKITTEQ